MKLKNKGLQRGKSFARSRFHNIFFKGLNQEFVSKIYFNRSILLYFSENCFGKAKKSQKVIIGRTFFEVTRHCSGNNSEF